MTWRFVDSDLAEPAFTVAADEAIALARSGGRVPNTLHFYRRKEPTVSMGYFQSVHEDIDLEFCRANGIQVLRRATGGSAIYTDAGHLIYGLVGAEGDLPKGANETYELICGGLVRGLGHLGLDAEFKPVNDVLVGGRKISGSAQMRRHGVVLQHGTLILSLNRQMMLGALKVRLDKIRDRGHEPDTYLTSLEEVLGAKPDISKVKEAVVKGLGDALDTNFEAGYLSEGEEDVIRELIADKYGKDSWNLKR